MSVVTIPSRLAVPCIAKHHVVAVSAAMREVLSLARKVAASEIMTVIVQGETGTGKEVIANLLHESSPRVSQRFIAINCAAIPEELLESELFGHERGAFTDARHQKQGLLELSSGGTLFLDEISQMPLRLQAKLLRVLETQCFRRVGGLEDMETDTRFVAASNDNLRTAARQGTFRLDLFYRLNVIQIRIPPLRERCDDILPLAEHFIDLYNAKFHRDIQGMEPEVRGALLRYHWPGNVRELRNTIERAMVLEESSRITLRSLPCEIRIYDGSQAGETDLSLDRNERRLILEALDRFRGNRTLAAAALGISRYILRQRMRRHGCSGAAPA